ncbi:MAG: hypothetical protein AB8G16_12665 [Gammaproteobacteria bacterium]
MARQNRNTLKNYFTDGSLPSATQFGELIDSTLNMKDEGFNRSLAHGFEVTALGDSTGLVSFFRDSQPLVPVWSIRLDESGHEDLCFVSSTLAYDATTGDSQAGRSADVAPALLLKSNGSVGVRTATPGCALDVNGTVRCSTRLGVGSLRQSEEQAAEVQVPADGQWHTISPMLHGCHALEVVAGVGRPEEKTGRFAMVHAIAMNAHGPRGWWFNFLGLKNRIRCRHTYHRSRRDKLALRWHVPKASRNDRPVPYYLQVRTRRPYGDGVMINYHTTGLWTDPLMRQSEQAGGAKAR